MNDAGYVLAAWAVVLGGLVIYALVTIWRGRRLSDRVPPEDRRWM